MSTPKIVHILTSFSILKPKLSIIIFLFFAALFIHAHAYINMLKNAYLTVKF